MKHSSIPILTTLALTAALAACSKTEPIPEPVRAVRTLTVGLEPVGSGHDYAAEVRARVESRLGFRVAGRVTERLVEVGQLVTVGQALARLDATDLRLSLDAANASSRAAQTSYDLAQAEYRRYKELRDQGFIGALELERREATLKAQKAALDQSQAQVQVQANQASYGVLTAPAAGVIVGVDAEVGAVLATGASVLRLAQAGPRDAVFSVPEDQAASIRTLLGRKGALNVRPWGSAATFPAHVREVAAAADPATRTFLVKADLGAAAVQLGQTLTVALAASPRPDGYRLPLTAVTQQRGQTAVWVVDPSTMTVRAQPISVAGADGNAVVVSNGLSAGWRVVTAGVHTLSAGQKVSFFAETPVAVSSASPVPAPASAASR